MSVSNPTFHPSQTTMLPDVQFQIVFVSSALPSQPPSQPLPRNHLDSETSPWSLCILSVTMAPHHGVRGTVGKEGTERGCSAAKPRKCSKKPLSWCFRARPVEPQPRLYKGHKRGWMKRQVLAMVWIWFERCPQGFCVGSLVPRRVVLRVMGLHEVRLQPGLEADICNLIT